MPQRMKLRFFVSPGYFGPVPLVFVTDQRYRSVIRWDHPNNPTRKPYLYQTDWKNNPPGPNGREVTREEIRALAGPIWLWHLVEDFQSGHLEARRIGNVFNAKGVKVGKPKAPIF